MGGAPSGGTGGAPGFVQHPPLAGRVFLLKDAQDRCSGHAIHLQQHILHPAGSFWGWPSPPLLERLPEHPSYLRDGCERSRRDLEPVPGPAMGHPGLSWDTRLVRDTHPVCGTRECRIFASWSSPPSEAAAGEHTLAQHSGLVLLLLYSSLG